MAPGDVGAGSIATTFPSNLITREKDRHTRVTSRYAVPSSPEILVKPLDLMHLAVQDGHDAGAAVRKNPPVDEVFFVATKIAVDLERRRNGTPGNASRGDGFEAVEQASDVVPCLGLAPDIACVA